MVSVIIPNYNHERYLQQRIDSVLEQTYTDFELIILDDCSTDNSKSLIELYRNHPKVSHIVYNTLNSGTTFKQWQKGLNLSKGDLIWIAESDDYCEPTLLETAVHILDADRDLNLFFTRSYQVDENNAVMGNTLAWSSDRPDYKWDDNFAENGKVFTERCMVQSNIIVNASAVVFRKAAISDIIFPVITSLRKAGDWFFWVSCILDGKVAYHGKQPLNYFREHQQSTRHLSNLQTLVLQKVEKYYVLLKIQQMLNGPNLKRWVDKCHLEMITMTPLGGYKMLKEILLDITKIQLSFPTYLYYKLKYSVRHTSSR